MLKKLSSTKAMAGLLGVAFLVAAALAVFGGRWGAVTALLLFAAVVSFVLLVHARSTKLQLAQQRRLLRKFERESQTQPRAARARASAPAAEPPTSRVEAEVEEAAGPVAVDDRAEEALWRLVAMLDSDGRLSAFDRAELARRFGRSMYDPRLGDGPVPMIAEGSPSTAESYARRARLLAALMDDGYVQPFHRIGALCGRSLEERLGRLGPVTQVAPNLGLEQLAPDTSHLVIDETALDETAWAGAMDAQHTVKFLDLYALVEAASARGAHVILIEREYASHFSADLRGLADTVFGSGEPRGVEERTAGAVVAVVHDSLKERAR